MLTKIDWNIINNYIERGLLISNKHPKHDIWILNYTNKCVYDKTWDEITLSCRGLIADKDGGIVARSFPKFFNLEEHNPSDIPTNLPFEVFEKIDGSLGILFNYMGEWILATRGSFESEQAIKGSKIFNEFCLIDPYIPKNLLNGFTYVFEIIYPENRIVCSYGDTENLILLGVINSQTGEEMSYDEMGQRYHKSFTIVKRYNDLSNISDISKLKELEEDNREGFVVRYSNGFRVKVKFNEYCRLHRIITNVSNKTIWESLKNGNKLDNIIDRVPDEFYHNVKRTVKELNDSYKEIELEAYKEYVRIINSLLKSATISFDLKKEFALKAKEFKYSGLLFSIYNNKDYSQAIWKMIKPEYSKYF